MITIYNALTDAELIREAEALATRNDRARHLLLELAKRLDAYNKAQGATIHLDTTTPELPYHD